MRFIRKNRANSRETIGIKEWQLSPWNFYNGTRHSSLPDRPEFKFWISKFQNRLIENHSAQVTASSLSLKINRWRWSAKVAAFKSVTLRNVSQIFGHSTDQDKFSFGNACPSGDHTVRSAVRVPKISSGLSSAGSLAKFMNYLNKILVPQNLVSSVIEY